MHFFLNRPDNIGDVILTMPLAAQLKKYFPDCKISMFARTYAKEMVEACLDIDQFICCDGFYDLDEATQIQKIRDWQVDVFVPGHPQPHLSKIMRKARVPIRIGYTNRFHYLWNANKILRIKRKRCDLHQAQMGLQFLKAFKLPSWMPREELADWIRVKVEPNAKMQALLDPGAFNLVLHPGTNGHTIEWPKEHFAKLIQILPPQVKIYLTGSAAEAEKYGDLVLDKRVVPLFGMLSLQEFIAFLKAADGVVVGSTGPLHISAAFGTRVLGLFPAQKDLNTERWGPLGKNASALEAPHCAISRPRDPKRCDCMKYITPEQVCDFIQRHWLDKQQAQGVG